ncbi:MAG: response regulator [Chloroflexi bacterium]|nr:response regulator [Chloroflexota bacterium]
MAGAPPTVSLEAVVAGFDSGAILTDPAGAVVYANPAAERLFGYEPGALVGLSLAELADRGEAISALDETLRAIIDASGWQGIVRCRRRDGAEVVSGLTVGAVRDEAGEVMGYLGVYYDPTQEQQLLDSITSLVAATRQQEERLARLHAIVVDLMGQPQVAAVLRSVVESARELFACDGAGLWLREGDEAVSHETVGVAVQTSGTRRPWRQGIAGQAMAKRRCVMTADYAAEPYATHALITKSLRSAMAAPLRLGDSVVGALTIVSQSTRNWTTADCAILEVFAQQAAVVLERARRTEQLERALEATRRLEARRREWVGMLAHDLRNLAIGVTAALHASQTAAQEAERFVEMAERNAHDLVELITTMLDVYRLEEGALPMRHERVEVSSLIQRAATSAQPAAHARGIDLQPIDPPGRVVVQGDAVLLLRVLQNLLSNALKFTAPGGAVQIRASVDEPSSVTLTVQDNGPGIPADAMPHLFDRFYQGSEGRLRGGVGLGLAFCDQVVRLHSGEIWAESAPTGATFSFRLPASVEAIQPTAPPTPALFQAEIRDLLASLRRAIVQLDESETQDQLLVSAYRAAHTIKGGVATLGLQEALEIATVVDHVLKDAVARRQPPLQHRQMLLEATDALAALTAAPDEPTSDLAPAVVPGPPSAVGTGPLVVLADDSPAIRVQIASCLEAVGFRVVAAADGVEAVRHTREHRPAVVVLDLTMPNLDGVEACRQLRRDPSTAQIPVIILSALDTLPESLADCRPDRHIVKAPGFPGLVETVRELARGSA